ncbi:serine protease [Pedobacter sp. Leaf176]|uniref:S1 family peptidase n=1 Tax=Pedobacter sp. Leaf176 TaxID=1736286 RepID=UPI0006FCE007|nr:serine protease [Pedobacter sp. Leaf176]KQR70454.1 hypothetical protein ASF92_10795 [Pedobacter sp. Leaf176]
MQNTSFFCKKINGPVLVSLGILFFVQLFTLSVRAQKEVDYVDYKQLLIDVEQNLNTEHKIRPLLKSSELRRQTLMQSDVRSMTSNFPKAGNKILTPAQVMHLRKEGVLMICKYFSATNAKPAHLEIFATATALSSDGLCVTNWHVMRDFLEPEVTLSASDSLTFVASSSGDIYPISKILNYSKEADAALFRVSVTKKPLSPIPLGSALDVGETVYTIGHPDGYAYYYSKGIVTRNTANNKVGFMGNRMEISADYAKGSSGGPILDESGNMVAMVSSTHSIYAQDRPQVNLQMVIKTTIPVASIKSLLEKSVNK